MKTLPISLGQRSYDIHIASGLLAQAGAYCRAVLPKATRLFLVTDTNVEPLYAPNLRLSLEKAGFQTATMTVEAGERAKSAAVLARLWEAMAGFGLTRTDGVVALGGGVVGDLAGFAAATYLRGVDFVQLPTTLLAQVDSSVGGKVAIDLEHGKNLAGAFWQPKLVLMDPDTLTTLNDQTFDHGMAEVIKYGCIQDAAFFDFLAAHPSRGEIMANIESVLYTCCDCKRKVVEMDERDTGGRMILNFGHTLGHAFELAGHYETWTHGQAVAAGMCAAADLGVKLGITPRDLPSKIRALVTAFDLPTHIDCTQAEYAAAIGLDKKGSGGEITLILLDALGSALLHKLPKQTLLSLL